MNFGISAQDDDPVACIHSDADALYVPFVQSAIDHDAEDEALLCSRGRSIS